MKAFPMLVVALTGGIATGKNAVAEVFKNLGCFVEHSDAVAHRLMEPGKPAWKEIVAHFGKLILNPDRTIDRRRLGSIVFADEKERLFLNHLLHPLVFNEKQDTIRKLKKEKRYKIFISEAALTIEAGYADFFDRIVLVYCRKKVQLKRLMERDLISRKEALLRIQSQMSLREKIRYADYVIDSSGTIPSTVEQAEQTYRNLLADYQSLSSRSAGKI